MALRLFGALLMLVVVGTKGWNDFCQISDVVGSWTITRDLDTVDDYKSCFGVSSSSIEHTITLSSPDQAEDEYGNYGRWTVIYGIGIEITIHGRKYFSFFPFKYNWRKGWTVDCNTIEPAASSDILTNNYACFSGKKFSAKVKEEKVNADEPPSTPASHPPTFFGTEEPIPTDVPTFEKEKFGIDHELIDRINSNDLKLWEAHPYDMFADLTEEEMRMMAGGNMSLRGRPPKPAPVTKEQLLKAKEFPTSFDWRNVDGVNYVSPVRNQGHCGSCYSFAALAAYESRIRIMTKNKLQPILSPQDIVNCSPYAYGCRGGWIYPEGKYAEQFGFVEEGCNAYSAEDEECIVDPNCKRYYGTNYQYVGGYFGASNEVLMMEAILNHGPVVVGYAIYYDFFYYRRGIYYHSGPDQLAGYHAVAVVGWGQDERSGTKYWIVKNSWGKSWGEDGFFRIVRGRNDCDIEAESFQAFPII